MNTTFTTCAEKKAKQFLNLLQGYTKGIRMTAILILLLMGVSNAWGADFQGQGDKAGWISGDSDEGLILTWNKNSSTATTKMKYKSLSSGGDLGSITTGLKLTKIEAKIWRIYKFGNICSATIFWELRKGDTFISSGSEDCTNWGEWSNNNCTLSQTLDIDFLSKTTGPGIYTIRVYGKLTGRSQEYEYNDPNYLGCSDNFWYNNNNNGYYSITFTIDPVVTFKANGGTGSDYTQAVKYNTNTALAANNFTRTNYTFAGWNTKADGSGTSYTDKQTVKLTANTTLYAKWTANKYTITWDPCGGTVTPTSSTYTYDGDALELPTPTQDGYRFEGWFTQKTGGTQITDVGESNKPTSNVTYFAHWTLTAQVELTITSHPERISNTDIFSLTITYKDVPEGFSVRIKRGNDYFNDATNGAHIPISGDGTINFTSTAPLGSLGNNNVSVELWSGSTGSYQNISSNAVTIIVETEYTVSLFAYTDGVESTQGGSIITSTPVKPTTNISKEISASEPNSGYTFTGWEVISGSVTIADKNARTTTITATSNGQVKANYTANTYTVTLSQEGAATPGTAEVTATYDADMPNIPELPTAANGYAFMGYWDGENGTGKLYYKADGTSELTWDKTEDATLYAYFQKAEITGIAFETGEVPEGGYVTFEPTIEPTPSGKTVVCWELKKGETEVTGHIESINETNNVKISIAELVTDKGKGIYTIKATLRTGTGCSGTELSSFETNFATTDFILSTPIYLKPGFPWKKDDARFAIYYWKGGNNGWVDMTTIGCSDEYYAAEIPIGYSDFMFVRLKPSTESGYDSNNNGLNFANAWNQTGNLSVQDGKNLYDMSKKLHLNRGTWNQDQNGRYAVYFFKEGDDDFGNAWVDLIAGNETDVYYCDVPSNKEYPNVIFCRMDPNQANGWDNNKVWHQTSNLSLEDGNYFTITSFGGGGNNAGGNWTYIYTGEWSTLNLPTITITNENKDYGSISVKTIDGTEIASGTKIDWDTEVIVSIQPEAGYAVASSEINIGGNAETIQSGKTYTICGNTTINISFKQKGEWYLAGEMNNWEIKDEYKLVDGKISVELKKEYDDNGSIKKPGFKLVQKEGDVTTWYGGGFGFKSLYPIGTLTKADEEGNHCSIEPVHNGDYLFVWDENTKKLTIEYPNVIFLHGDFNGWKDKAPHALHDRDAKVYLTAGDNYEFKVAEKGIYYTTKDDSKALSTHITMDDPTEYADNCTYYASITGLYTFHFDKETRILTVTPPIDNTLAEGDYRLQYTNDSENYYTDHVKKRTSGDGVDTVSLFILNAGATPRVILQQYSSGTWTNVNTYNLSSMTTLDDEMTNEHGGVWNFIISQTNNGVNAEVSNATTPERYTGKYYIRTNAADGGWYEYMIPENEIFFSSYARDNEGFDYYYCKYIGSETNVKYNIANDYNSKLNPADHTYGTGDLIQSETLPADGNVRFMWNSRTNELVGRAYLDGSSTENFLRITDATNLQNLDGNSINQIKFADLQNWIYQVDVQANTDTKIKLRAIYNGNEQFFKGDANNTVSLLTSNNSEKTYKIRLIYNFKTNHLVCAWLGGDETITTDEKLTADMMIIRRDQEQAEQLSFNPNTKQLDLVGTAYAVMTFTKAFIQNETYKERQRSLYWVSFPFDVKISDVFGFGEYGEHWILQYYDGAERAKKGLFIDSGTYWKYITNTETILKKGVGYVLALDLNKVQFLHGVEDVSLYFPSMGNIGVIKGDGETTSMDVPAHECTITHGAMDRRIYDSHWNLIGIPGFTDPGMIDVTNYNNQIPATFLEKDANLGFHYEFDLATNTYNVKRSTVAFKTMYSYLVQYAGTMNWKISAIDNNPAQIAARRNSNSNVPEKVSLRLEIAQDEQMIDQTFVQLQQEKATAEFDMNLDLTKIINSGANIYTLAGTNRIQTAGNTLPMENATVPVGVVISKAGEYTFRMPDGTDGIMAELIDYETNTTTNLLYDEYTVTLTKGTFESRFALFVRPNNTATSIENINGESTSSGKKVRKVLIDNILYIIRDGQMYDARGVKVK